MNLRKNLGRVASTIVATALLASVATVPTFAAGASTAQNADGLTSITLNKKLVLPDNVAIPNQTFTFTVTGDNTVDADDTITSNGVTMEVKEGQGTGTGTAAVSPASSRDTNNYGTITGTDVVTVDLTITLPAVTSFTSTGAGIYKYNITENEITNAEGDVDTDFTNATPKGLDLYLIVERVAGGSTDMSQDTYKITGAMVYPDGTTPSGDSDAKTADFVNYYKVDDSGAKVGNLKFTKVIAGAMGNKNDKFVFEVSSDKLENGVEYSYVKNEQVSATADVQKATAANGKLTFSEIGHNDYIIILGLDEGSYNVKETTTGNGYVISIGDDDDTDATNGVNKNVSKNTTVATTITNTRDSVTPTGIIMNVAPYALLVVVAVAGCFVFLRKRNED